MISQLREMACDVLIDYAYDNKMTATDLAKRCGVSPASGMKIMAGHGGKCKIEFLWQCMSEIMDEKELIECLETQLSIVKQSLNQPESPTMVYCDNLKGEM